MSHGICALDRADLLVVLLSTGMQGHAADTGGSGIQEVELRMAGGQVSLVVEQALGDLVDDILAQILGGDQRSLNGDADDLVGLTGVGAGGQVVSSLSDRETRFSSLVVA